MAIVSIARPQTTLEAFGPVVKDLFQAIDTSKRLRGERLQVESVFKSLDSLGEEATPEERMAAIRGGLLQVRATARSDNEGLLQKIISGLDPRVPSFEGVSPMEKFIADQQLRLASQDPLTRRAKEAALTSAEARAGTAEEQAQATLEATQALTDARGRTATGAERPLTRDQLGRRAIDMNAFIEKAPRNRRIGPNTRQESLLQAWKNYKAAPSTKWDTLNDVQRDDEWRAFKAIIAKKQSESDEFEFDPTSPEVQAATPGIEQPEPTGARQPLGPELSKTLPANITFSELAELAQGLDASSQNELLEIQRRFFDAQKSGDEQAIAAAGADYQEAITILRGRR